MFAYWQFLPLKILYYFINEIKAIKEKFMSDFQISSLQGNQNLSALAQKCDVNNDGILDDNEYSIFSEGKNSLNEDPGENFYNFGSNDRAEVTIGGVKFRLAEVDKFKKNKEGSQFDNSVLFKSGMIMNYDVQSKENGAIAYSSEPTLCNQTCSDFRNFSSGDGLQILGSKYDDSMSISNSNVYNVIGYQGNDSVFTDNCQGKGPHQLSNITSEGSMIFAENFSDIKSKGLYQH